MPGRGDEAAPTRVLPIAPGWGPRLDDLTNSGTGLTPSGNPGLLLINVNEAEVDQCQGIWQTDRSLVCAYNLTERVRAVTTTHPFGLPAP
ncbi:hypothetical protein GCM10010174_91150 [Kutzneria viridogrisea]